MNNLNNQIPYNDPQVPFDNYVNMLMAHPNRILLRSILLTMIDHTLIYDNLNNNERAQANNVYNNANNNILDLNAQWLVDNIMNLVENAIREDRLHMFQRIAALFHNNNIVG